MANAVSDVQGWHLCFLCGIREEEQGRLSFKSAAFLRVCSCFQPLSSAAFPGLDVVSAVEEPGGVCDLVWAAFGALCWTLDLPGLVGRDRVQSLGS